MLFAHFCPILQAVDGECALHVLELIQDALGRTGVRGDWRWNGIRPEGLVIYFS